MKAKTVGLILFLAIVMIAIAGGITVAVILDNAEADNLSVSSVDINTTGETANNPIGFEAVLPIAGLSAVAYLVLRQREG